VLLLPSAAGLSCQMLISAMPAIFAFGMRREVVMSEEARYTPPRDVDTAPLLAAAAPAICHAIDARVPPRSVRLLHAGA